MKDGTFTYYTFQHRRTHESPWLKPDEPLAPVDDREWHFSNWDSFGYIAEPRESSNENHRDETHEVWASTGHKGWWTLRYAVLGLNRLRKASETGEFNSRHYGNVVCAMRFEFRLVKIIVSQETTHVSCEEIAALVQ